VVAQSGLSPEQRALARFAARAILRALRSPDDDGRNDDAIDKGSAQDQPHDERSGAA
jgi:hypothetical protein